MIIENGKRYVRADGEVTGVIEDSGGRNYPHYNPESGATYTDKGVYSKGETSYLDLVSEYVEPAHQYGPWKPMTCTP